MILSLMTLCMTALHALSLRRQPRNQNNRKSYQRFVCLHPEVFVHNPKQTGPIKNIRSQRASLKTTGMLFLLFDLIRLHSTCQAWVVAINDIKLWRFYFPCGGCGNRPGCAIILSRSATPQCSTILLFSKRQISITVMAKDLSVGSCPMNGLDVFRDP